MRISFTVNGSPRTIETFGLARLIDVLREDLMLTGTKEGCGEGECGACTVLLDGAPVNSCLLPAGQVSGRDVVTVEGMGAGHRGGLHPFQAALAETGGVQCGICTPGIVVAGAAFLSKALAEGSEVSDLDARHALAGNLCRCTGWVKIVEALLVAHRRMRASAGSR